MAAPELWWLWVTLAVSTLIYYLTHQHRRRRRRDWGSGGSGRRRPPGPRPLPLIGNLLDLHRGPAGGGNLHHTLARLARAHAAPVMGLDLGLVPAVVVSSRAAAREAFTAANDRRMAARPVRDTKRALGLCDRSVLSLPSSDPLWRHLRGVLAAHVLSPRSLAASRAARQRKVADLVGYIRARAGTVVDVKEAVYGGVANLVSTAMFSIDVVDVGGGAAAESSSPAPAPAAHGLQELVEELMESIGKPNVSDFFPFLRTLDLQGCRRRVAVQLGKVLQILGDIVDRRLAEEASSSSTSGEKHGDFLDVLLEVESTGKITRDNLTLLLFDIFTAGSDTMALTVVWAMAELLHNPSVMAKLRAEIRDAIGGDKDAVEEADAAGLPYLQAVVREAMRLHPAAPVLLPHKAVEDGVEIGGYAVPKGCTVIFNSWAIMRDPAAWERPDEFVPERFLGRERELDFRGKQLEFVPFGSGRRMCPGVPMVERVVPLVLAALVHAFEWQLPAGMSAEQVDVSDKFTNTSVLAFPPIKAVPLIIS